MATLLADSPAPPASEQAPATGQPGDAPTSGPEPPKQQCAKCGAGMEPDQEWCLQCGAGVPGSLTRRAPSWRSTATILGATAILVIAAATAAYAALTKKNTSQRPATVAIVRPGAATGAPLAPGATAPLPPAVKTPTVIQPAKTALPKSIVKPPKIPITAATPTPAATTKPAATTPATTPAATTPASSSTGSAGAATPPPPAPILLDTNAVSTYNPNGYPASEFGEPSLTIDGETSTGWTAPVEPAIAPKMAVGLVVDLRAPQRLSTLELITSTPGMTVQVLGANASSAPATISDPGWVKLSRSFVQKKRHEAIKLSDSTKGFRFVLLWISGAPAASVGTPHAPGRVSVNELELFPAK